MPEIQLPDGSKRTFDGPVSVMEVATDIGPGLARATLAGEVDGELVDASHRMHTDAKLRLITERDPEALDLIRHSTAHLMAQAVQRLYPKAQVTIGPVIEHGFFYDFSYPPGFTEEDLVAIEKEMKNVVKQGFTVERSVMSRAEAVSFFKEKGENFKVEVIESIPGDEDLGFYQQGEFIDLCRGPHVPDTGKLKAFKLMSVAGAYWRGDSSKPMLQRIYGTAWANKKDLKAHLHRLEEAKKRDHRRLGKQLDLFHTQPEAPGMIFWHDRGWKIYIAIQTYLRAKLRRHGYQEINTPQLVDRVLWEKSGHWDKFGDMMFSTSSENRDYAIKPMNCPCHVQVFNQGLKSYRDLPLRMAEFGSCHRNEPSGTLHGLMRVRNFVQDDAHIFCTEAQIQPEVSSFIDLVYEVYEDFGFENIIVKLSTRPEQRVGSDADWDRSEKALATALDDKKLDWDLQPGEGAFYGPKIEFSLKDSLERVWQCGTMQVDFSTPGKLDASYVDEDSKRQTPVMLHRAILGSLERFIGVLIEHYAGAFPVWLAPVQLVFISIADRHHDYCREMADLAQNSGLRVDLDLRNEKIGFKIREQTIQRVPYMLIIGDNEVDERQVAVRSRSGENLGSMSMDGFIHRLQSESAVH